MQILSRLLRPSSAAAAGLDLSDSSLTWVALSQRKGRGLVLQGCLFEPLAPGWVVNGEITDFGQVEAALRRLMRRVSASTLDAVKPGTLALGLAVPAVLVNFHRARYPANLSQTQLAERVQADIAQEQQLQLRHEDLCVDFHRERAAPDASSSGQTDWRAAGVLRAAVEDRIALVEGTGLPLHPVVMASAFEAGVHAGSRVILAQGAGALVQLVQLLDGPWFCLDILEQTGSLQSKRFKLGESLSPHPDSNPVLPEGLVQALMAPETGVGGDVAAVLRERPLKVWFCGPPDAADAWAAALQLRTGLPCERIDVFEGMALSEAIEGSSLPKGAQALVACGLALMALPQADRSRRAANRTKNFNFLPYRQAARARQKEVFLRQLGAVAVSVLLATGVVRWSLWAQLASEQATQAALSQEIARLELELKRVSASAPDAKRLQLHAAKLMAFAQMRQQLPLTLQELSALLPEGLNLTSLRREQGGSAIVSGQARSAADVFELIERMAGSSRYFTRPALLDLSFGADPTTAGLAERVVFTLRAQQP